MLPTRLAAALLVLPALAGPPVPTQPVPDEPLALIEASREAASRRDDARALDLLARAARLLPFDPRVPYDRAKLLARAGRDAEALVALREAFERGGAGRAPEEAAFATMKTRPEALRLFVEIADRNRPKGEASVAFTVRQKDLLPEGIAHDPRSGAFFLSSLYRRKVVRVAPDGAATDFAGEARDGLWKTVGLKVDAARGRLWVMSGADDAAMARVEPEGVGRSGAFVYDLVTGALLRKSVLDGRPHFLNDAAILPDGDALVTDSEAGALLRVSGSDGAISTVLPPRSLPYPNGVVATEDGRRALVAHAAGVALVDVATGSSREVRPCKGVALVGLDGLAWSRGTLIAVQNGLFPDKVVRYRLSADLGSVESAEVLLRADPRFRIPTTAAVAGDDLYVVANSHLDAFDSLGRPQGEGPTEPVVLKVPLGTGRP